MKLIYGYKKKDEDKFVYIGQTCRFQKRRYEHEKIEAFNPEREEYNYPLSRAFRKYGVDAFECIILEENIPNDKVNEREQYWIKYYNTYNNGYNQTPGGDARIEITDEDIDDIYVMLRAGLTYQKIANKMGICIACISMINNGIAYARDNENYPIAPKKFGQRLPEEIVNEVIQLLLDKKIKVRDIASVYGIGFNVVVRINQGQSYKRDDLTYPLRRGRVRESKDINYQQLLQELRESLEL